MITLKDITKENWFDVVLLRSREDQKNKIFEKDIASNCFSLTQASIEGGWVTKAIYDNETLVGFTMYGYSEELKGYEVGRIMIDFKFQGKGYGKQSLELVLKDMVDRFQCEKILLTFHPENIKAKSLYEAVGFKDTGETVKHFVEELIYAYDTGVTVS
ncbi:GNAT family N-acetyltransferase [Bacillus sp. 31A1R]|uniref:GNAT family N-acetyltransferase n=1 Tax=Robertmurraya mangrovi TaxID=3098077 RepID=A0ABU5J0R6_9BACI|nr:GNAT family N-acetyltransferase [Bacillus sp. 31A1R]MDZ5473013.1 GNAT family N-acetyltransferase [Bacillus sp. 31A1R]